MKYEDNKKNTLKNRSFFENPYRKFEKLGCEFLNEDELLAIILRTGTRDKTALDVSRELLSFGEDGILNLARMSYQELKEFPGIGRVKAMELKAVFELGKRIKSATYQKKMDFFSPETIANYYMEKMRHENKEQLVICMFDAKGRFMGESLLTVGSISNTIFSPREIFSAAFKKNAACIVMLHNHPSGVPNPSKDDIYATKEICELGIYLECKVLDHIIIGDNTYFSFAENKMLYKD